MTVDKLQADIAAAGFKLRSVSRDGSFIPDQPVTKADEQAIAAIIAAHDWSPPPPPPEYVVDRTAAYTSELSLGNMLDAIFKAMLTLGFKPDPSASPDTPEGALGRIRAIKDKYPKP